MCNLAIIEKVNRWQRDNYCNIITLCQFPLENKTEENLISDVSVDNIASVLKLYSYQIFFKSRSKMDHFLIIKACYTFAC